MLRLLPIILFPSLLAADPLPKIGLIGSIGAKDNPTRAPSLLITKPGAYENYLIDPAFAGKDAVRIKADKVVLRNCEIRNGLQDAIEVYGSDVLIENCKIHHFLAGTFKEQKDAHGITGRPTRLTVRNCEISYVSGDCLQFDPGRGPWDDVTIENCKLFTGPLSENAAGFKKGEQPGENALDTKQSAKNPRSHLTMRNGIISGFAKGGQIANAAGVNIKNNVDVRVENCLFIDNEIAARLRGPGKKANPYGGAHATLIDCFFYKNDTVFRVEDNIEKLQILRPRFGEQNKQDFHFVGSPKLAPEDPQPAPPLKDLVPTP